MNIAALGMLPIRIDSLLKDNDMPQREITGWETLEQGMARCQILSDCSLAIVHNVIEK